MREQMFHPPLIFVAKTYPYLLFLKVLCAFNSMNRFYLFKEMILDKNESYVIEISITEEAKGDKAKLYFDMTFQMESSKVCACFLLEK